MAENRTQCELQAMINVFLIISEVWQGYDSKAYGVSNHNLKLQCKKFNRTRDIRNFPTQGWADTAFCTRKRSETYIYYAFSLRMSFFNTCSESFHTSQIFHLNIHFTPSVLPAVLQGLFLLQVPKPFCSRGDFPCWQSSNHWSLSTTLIPKLHPTPHSQRHRFHIG